MTYDLLDLFAGPGGVGCGARQVGLTEIGLEWGRHECATRSAASLATIRTDVAAYPVKRFVGIEGLWASPPCPDFSTAGLQGGLNGETGWLTEAVPTWVEAIRPRWFACEQVPPAVFLWRQHAQRYRELGYKVWVGMLSAERFGVAQTRRRAILMAHRDRQPQPPEPTHGRWESRWGHAPADLFSRPPVVLADAIGLGPYRDAWPWHRPASTLTTDRRLADPGRRKLNGGVALCMYPAGRTFTTDQLRAGDFTPGVLSVRLTLREALIVQGFPPDWPVQGSPSIIGNAVPPPMAAAILRQLTLT